MIDKIPFHKHTGVDGSPKIPLKDLEFIKQAPITAPTGGATIDSNARTAINSIITALEELGLVNRN